MPRRFWPILNTLLFTILVPGTVAILIPRWLLGGFSTPQNGVLTWIGGIAFVIGAAIYFRCAWEFAARGLGTPAPIAPTKFLVTTALHRHVPNPTYIGVALAILGEAELFRSIHVAEYAAIMLLTATSSWSCMKSLPCSASSGNRMRNIAGTFRAGCRGSSMR
jgi:hypothetical protein